MKGKKISIYELYFQKQQEYAAIHGDKTIVFMQVGSFYESYCTSTRGYTKLAELQNLLDIQYIDRSARKNSNKPSQLGIPVSAFMERLTILMDNDYKVVLFDQTASGKNAEREFVNVFTPGTFSREGLHVNNHIIIAYMKQERQIKTGVNILAVGVAIADVTTGLNIIHEFQSSESDEKFGLDELIRVMQSFPASETIIYYQPSKTDAIGATKLKKYLNCEDYRNCSFYVYEKDACLDDTLGLLSPEVFKIVHQNDFLANIYDFNHQLTLSKKKSPLEILHLERKIYATVAFILMLKYLQKNNTRLLRNISYPELYIYNRHLILGNNAIEQLNVMNRNGLETYNKKIESLLDVVDFTRTAMGKRFIRQSLVNPLSRECRSDIKSRYAAIATIMRENLAPDLALDLKNITDLEKIHRKMATATIVPQEFYRLTESYAAVLRIHHITQRYHDSLPNIASHIMKEFQKYQSEYQAELNLELMSKIRLMTDIEASFFYSGIYENIDIADQNCQKIKNRYSAIMTAFENIIDASGKKTGYIELKKKEKSYHFKMSKAHALALKQALTSKKYLKFSANDEDFQIDKKEIKFQFLKTGAKVSIATMTTWTDSFVRRKDILARAVREVFMNSMMKYYREYQPVLHAVSNFITQIDFIVSGAEVATKYHYCQPEIPSENNIACYLQAKALRHAIAERLCTETEFVPNGITLGNCPAVEQNFDATSANGVLIYGLNCSGKSTFMKAIGLALILAQIGYYVPASSFVYEPYMSLYARITGNDNVFKGLSCFGLEMTELDAILLRCEAQGETTMVIGDEVCRGTEILSAKALVASAIVGLSEFRTSFIFSSHLHEIPEIDEVAALKNLRVFHMAAEYDANNDCLVHNHVLTPGIGPKDYGIMVAKYYVKNAKFLTRAETIKKRLMSEPMTDDIPTKVSHFNSDRVVKCCAICYHRPLNLQRELECHHIHFQHNCLSDGKIRAKPYLSKNKLYNLVILCRDCHVAVHSGEISISGYLDTSIGPILNYRYDHVKKIQNAYQKIKNLTLKSSRDRQQHLNP